MTCLFVYGPAGHVRPAGPTIQPANGRIDDQWLFHCDLTFALQEFGRLVNDLLERGLHWRGDRSAPPERPSS